jgi:putative flippase GtrA
MSATGTASEKLRYLINGILATLAHYLVLHTAMDGLGLGSAGLANLLGSAAGIATSYIGNRHFVYRQTEAPLLAQGSRFMALYVPLAAMHGGVLYLWTDRLGLNYRIGFLVTIALQVIIGYFGNKHLVFKSSPMRSGTGTNT